MTRGYVGPEHAQVHYRADGDGTPVVLLHPSPSSSAMWQPLMPELAARGYRAVAFDLPGYGLSDPPAREPSLQDYADWVVASAAALGLDSFHIVGQHTGASVALAIAARHPGRVLRIVGYGIPWFEPEMAQKLATEAAPEYDAAGTALVAKWRLYWDRAGDQADAPALASRTVAEMLLAGTLLPFAHRAVGNGDHAALLDALDVPMLGVAGERDILAERTRLAAERFANVTLAELAGVGAFVADERSVEYATLIDEFLRATG
jgi:pimeloyl-ACP methyl ester carboxylesterase